MRRLILSFLLINIFASAVVAQIGQAPPTADTTENVIKKEPPKPKVPKSFYIPTGLRIGADLVGLGISTIGTKRDRYEIQGDIDFHRFYLSGSYGIANFKESGDEFTYENEGSYFRIGVDANVLKMDPDFNTLTFGVRYAVANFSESLATNRIDPVYGAYSENFTNPDVSARWFELTTGLRVMLLENLYTGYTFRIQLSRKLQDASNFRSYDIPGFGLSEFKNRWTFNYYIVYRIAWREKKVFIPGS
ncbi:hypothetical protein GCM10011506_30840 [Marivirga lumbricoides]|uniref:Outer membrane protein beta-barrel domain-containing protein n=1 Tax=Marivirga lumbricoides TaxID=1046115 RepID=A0ABQ1MMY6_9BACT|nr:hypothetical protein GCM10011506_30840 [Marivirga lumbricoides]